MINDPGESFFPYNAVNVLKSSISVIDPDIVFVGRKLDFQDPNQSVGISPIDWIPGQLEIGRQGPSTQFYLIYIQAMIIDPDEERGLRIHSFFSKEIRELLARSNAVRVALGSLKTTDSYGVREKTLRHTIGNQTFHHSEPDGNWYYLSTLELRIETQIEN